MKHPTQLRCVGRFLRAKKFRIKLKKKESDKFLIYNLSMPKSKTPSRPNNQACWAWSARRHLSCLPLAQASMFLPLTSSAATRAVSESQMLWLPMHRLRQMLEKINQKSVPLHRRSLRKKPRPLWVSWGMKTKTTNRNGKTRMQI